MGGNYGWPESQGDEVKAGTNAPFIHSGADTTWAPAGTAIVADMMYFGGLRGQALYVLPLSSQKPAVQEWFSGQYGRIRVIIAGPNGALYISTSNCDGQGIPLENDDKILQVQW